PWFSLQSRSDPVMPVEHFARDLRISRLIGAKQTEGAESIEEKEPAERNKQQHVSPRSRTHVNQAGRGRTSAQMLTMVQTPSSTMKPIWKGWNAIHARIAEPAAFKML